MRHPLRSLLPALLASASSCCMFCEHGPTPSRAIATVSLLAELDADSHAVLRGLNDADRQAAVLAMWRHAHASLRPGVFAVLGRHELRTGPGGWVDAAAWHDLERRAVRGLFEDDPPPGPVCIYDESVALSIKCAYPRPEQFEVGLAGGGRIRGRFAVELHVDQRPAGVAIPVR